MIIKNTDKDYSIAKKNIKNKLIKATAGILVFSTIFLVCPSLIKNAKKEKNDTSQAYYEYWDNYYETLEEIDTNAYDQNFTNLTTNGFLVINNQKYSIRQLYIFGMDDGYHLVDINNKDVDLLTGNKIEGKKTTTTSFKSTEALWEYYDNNRNNLSIGNDNQVTLKIESSEELSKLISILGTTAHSQTPDAVAANTARKGGR